MFYNKHSVHCMVKILCNKNNPDLTIGMDPMINSNNNNNNID